MVFIKGDIILPLNRIAKKKWLEGLHHPAVVWDDLYDGEIDFNGIMLTHSPPNSVFKNVLMDKTHFEEGYEFVFSKTHFVNQVFMKYQQWGPFELVGKLKEGGIEFIGGQLNPDQPPLDFVFYRNAMNGK